MHLIVADTEHRLDFDYSGGTVYFDRTEERIDLSDEEKNHIGKICAEILVWYNGLDQKKRVPF